MGILWSLLIDLLIFKVAKAAAKVLSAPVYSAPVYKRKLSDYRSDPVYKGNLERLIEHHQQFEKKQ
jgi:hypothetical protein